jgi:hypothetical protein
MQQYEPTFGLDPEDVERGLRFVRSIRWQQARTTPGDEHEYSLPEWAPDQSEREWFVVLVREKGYRETFRARGDALAHTSGSRWTYLELGDGYRIWCSRVWTDDRERRPMLNRARLADVAPDPQMRMDLT